MSTAKLRIRRLVVRILSGALFCFRWTLEFERWAFGFIRAIITRISCIGKRTASPKIAFRSLKIRPDLLVLLVADSAHSLQIVSASERPRRNDARRDYVTNSGTCR